MFISVRGCTDNSIGSCRQLDELSVISQASNDFPGLIRSQAVLLIIGLAIVLVAAGVILPAVWSAKKTRRTAALDVLDRLLRWRR